MASSASDDKVGRDKMLSYIKKQKAKILELESTISALQSRAETENLSSLDANGKNASEKISNSSVSHTEEANQSNDSKKVDDQASVALLEETRKELNMFKNRCEELELGLSESRCQLKEALDSAADSQDIIKDLTEQLSVTKSENARALELAVSRAMAAEEECSRTTKRMADEYAVFQMDAEACYLQRLSAQEKELADALACRNVLESRIVLLEEEKGRLQAELGVSTQEAYRALSDRSNTMADLEAEETVSSERNEEILLLQQRCEEYEKIVYDQMEKCNRVEYELASCLSALAHANSSTSSELLPDSNDPVQMLSRHTDDSQIDILKIQISNLSRVCTDLEEELTAMKQASEQAQADINALTAENSTLRTSADRAEKATSMLQELMDKFKTLQTRANSDIDNLKKQHEEELFNLVQEHRQHMSVLQRELEGYEIAANDACERLEVVRALEREKTTQIQELEAECQKLRSEIRDTEDVYKEKLNVAEKKIMNLVDKLNGIEGEIQAEREKSEKLLAENDKLEEELKDVDAKQKRLKVLLSKSQKASQVKEAELEALRTGPEPPKTSRVLMRVSADRTCIWCLLSVSTEESAAELKWVLESELIDWIASGKTDAGSRDDWPSTLQDQASSHIAMVSRKIDEAQEAAKLSIEKLDELQEQFNQYKLRAQAALKKATAMSNNERGKLEMIEAMAAEIEGLKRDIFEKEQMYIERIEELIDHHRGVELKSQCVQTDSTFEKDMLKEAETLTDKANSELNEAKTQMAIMKDEYRLLKEEFFEQKNNFEKAVSEIQNLKSLLEEKHNRFPMDSSYLAENKKDAHLVIDSLWEKDSDISKSVHSLSHVEEEAVYNKDVKLMAIMQEEQRRSFDKNRSAIYIARIEAELMDAAGRLELMQCQVNALKEAIRQLEEELERERHFNTGADAEVNVQYLKTAMFHYMSTSDVSEQRRLLAVVATLLKLRSEEVSRIEARLDEIEKGGVLRRAGGAVGGAVGSVWGFVRGSNSGLNDEHDRDDT